MLSSREANHIFVPVESSEPPCHENIANSHEVLVTFDLYVLCSEIVLAHTALWTFKVCLSANPM
jgi:hypothetical protein